MSQLTRISISLEDSLLRRFDQQAARDGYPTRSEAIKALMRHNLAESQWAENHAGAITLVYDHRRRGTTAKIIDVQHDFESIVVSTQHVHLDHDHCLEIVVVKGRASGIRKLSAALNSIKGVMHNSLVMAPAGEHLQ